MKRILGNSRSATGLTKDDINNVTSAFKDLDNFDPASIFEETPFDIGEINIIEYT